ncbi:MAG: undecaprenyl-diphosphate phosphatase [Planctomycetota bacterium]|nr:undecaprenyl-diphosphate phosphatase [Planctomycetota bacterium]
MNIKQTIISMAYVEFMIFLEVVLLAIAQGITEFLPVSSSGHLVVLAAVFERFGVEMDEKLTLNIILHLGTLLAILVFYRRRIIDLLSKDRHVIGLLAIGTIPAVAVGIPMKKYCEELLVDPLLAGPMFLVTAGMLLWTRNNRGGELECRELSYRHAFVIGIFQAFAILPGVSRSGSTIVAGLGCGLRREEAATFSFLLAIPVIGGAGFLDLKDLLGNSNHSVSLSVLAIGAAVSFAVGLAALSWLVNWVRHGHLHWFVWWLVPLGIIVTTWQVFW